MTKRMKEMMESLWARGDIRADQLDKNVLKKLIKAGQVKRIQSTRIGPGIRSSVTMIVALVQAPIQNETNTGGPYAKRKAQLDSSGLPYRGKTWGKIRLDLPRQAREKEISDKKKMWAKLKRYRA